MAAFTPFNYDEDIGKQNVIVVCSYGPDNMSAIREIDEWAREHGYVRSREATLNVKLNMNGQRYFYSACYLLDADDMRAAEVDLARIGDRREQMALTASSADLLRDED